MTPVIEIPKDFYLAALSIFILSFGSIFALMQRVFPKSKKILSTENTQTIFLALSLLASTFFSSYQEFLNESFVSGQLTQVSHILILSVSLFISLLFRYHPLRKEFFQDEVSFLYMLITIGMLIFVSSHDLVTLLIGLEISSLGIYTLIGYLDPNRKSLEGAIKYFILGSVATAFLLFGMGLVYASCGSLNIQELLYKTNKLNNFIWLQAGLLFLISGFGFKLALVPFHMWTPDAYESAPTGITTLMATSFKTIIVILLLRLSPFATTIGSMQWIPSLSLLACLSILIGNIMALIQISLKRTLAYSSIAHSGYIAIGLCCLSQQAAPHRAILFYLVSYIVASLLSFGSLMFMETTKGQNLSLDDVKGYGKKNPWLAFTLSFSLISLAGLPPTVGFLGKLFVFEAALENSQFVLIFIAVLGSAISLYYYLRVIVYMYMHEAEEQDINTINPEKRRSSYLLAFPLALAILLGTLLPQSFFDYMEPKVKEITKKFTLGQKYDD